MAWAPGGYTAAMARSFLISFLLLFPLWSSLSSLPFTCASAVRRAPARGGERVRRSVRRCAAMLGMAGLLAACQSLPPPPATAQRAEFSVLHGQRVEDPYRWLEATQAPEVQQWMRAQSAHTRGVLDRIAPREALLQRMLEVEDGSAARTSRVAVTASGAVFALRREAGAAQPAIVRWPSVEAAAAAPLRVLDPQSFGPRHAVDYFFPSPDGRFVAYGVSEAGSEAAEFRVREVATGRDVVGPVAGAKFNGHSPYRWAADGSAVHFATTRDEAGIKDKADAFQWVRVWRVAAREGARPEPVVDGLARIGPPVGPHEMGTVLQWSGSPYEVLYLEDGVKREVRALVRPRGVGAGTAWQPLIGPADAVWQFELQGEEVYGLTHLSAERFRIVATRIGTPDWRQPRIVLPEQRGVLRAMRAAADALYVVVLEGGSDKLLRVPYAGGAAEEVALPFPGAITLAWADGRRPGVLLELGGWTQARAVYLAAAGAKSVVRTELQPLGRHDTLASMSTRIEEVVSHDGVRVPLSIVQKTEAGAAAGTVAARRPRPTAIVAYGAYGFSQEPRLRAEWVPWLERGYVMATCHVRGGGEYGAAWYAAGRKATKPNTWKDLIACAEHLVKSGVTTPAQLGLFGWSAGGIAVGRAMTERPDLFAAVAPGVGVLDAVRAELEPNGPGNIAEFGSVATEAGFKALLAMSSLHHVQPGVRYPAVILPHGANDQRVAVWQSSKMAAALQTASPRSVTLLNIDFDAGHGPGSAARQRLSTFADSAAFMLWQMGEPAFVPR